MAQTVTTRSDVIEAESTSAVTQLILAGLLLFGCLLLVYFFHFIPARHVRLGLQIIAAAGAIAGLIWAVVAIFRMRTASTLPKFTVNCPYCDFPMQFVQEPHDDYDCENCHRRVYYENGQPVPIKMITCAFCKTVHKVSAQAKQFTCDRCNRALRLTDGPGAPGAGAERDEILQNYDVVLTDIGRKATDVAMALESILVCNLAEARRQMANLPLTLMRNVPERKADAVRRRLRDLGATAVVRPTESSEQARAGR
jgi:ribosomal protein L7/L12